MTGTDAKLANAAAIEQYGKAVKAKGLATRADWAFAQAARMRREVASVGIPATCAA